MGRTCTANINCPPAVALGPLLLAIVRKQRKDSHCSAVALLNSDLSSVGSGAAVARDLFVLDAVPRGVSRLPASPGALHDRRSRRDRSGSWAGVVGSRSGSLCRDGRDSVSGGRRLDLQRQGSASRL